MLAVCLEPALVAAHVATKHLSPGGLLALIGSEAALHATPGMLAYGLAKAATHQLVRSVAPLPEGARCVGLLPRTLDTPNNRKWMAEGADTSSWTPLSAVTGALAALADHRQAFDVCDAAGKAVSGQAVLSGALISVVTEAGATKFTLV